MSTKVMIRNAEPEGSNKCLAVEVVTAGGAAGPEEQRHLLSAGQEATVELVPGRFLMIDDKEI